MKKYIKGKWGLDTFLQDKNNQTLVSGTANTVSGTISALDVGNQFGNKSSGTTVASSALTGLSMGASLGPIGMGVGAGLGGLYGLIKANKDRKQEQSLLNDSRNQQATLALNNTRNRSISNPELFNGSLNNSYYETGGILNNHLLGKAKGGQLHQLTENDSIIKGNTHEEGGVKFPEQGVELENNETLNGDFVFSKELGFADKHLKIIKDKQKLESLLKDRPNDRTLINSLELTDRKVDKLKQEQEETKALLGLNNDVDNFARGGSLFTADDLLSLNLDYDNLPSANVVETQLQPKLSSNYLVGSEVKKSSKDSIAVRNNNPRNIKFGSFAEKFGAIKGDKATDGGVFAKFPTVEAGLEAGKELFKSKGYRDLDVDSALKRWSNSGYGVNIYPELQGKKVKDLTDNELGELTKRQIKMEDKNMYNKLYGTKKFALGGYLSLADGGSLSKEEIRIKKLMDNFLTNLPNRNKKDSINQIKLDKKNDLIRIKQEADDKRNRKNVINNFSIPKINNEAIKDGTQVSKKDINRAGSPVKKEEEFNLFNKIFSNSNRTSNVPDSRVKSSKSRKTDPYVLGRIKNNNDSINNSNKSNNTFNYYQGLKGVPNDYLFNKKQKVESKLNSTAKPSIINTNKQSIREKIKDSNNQLLLNNKSQITESPISIKNYTSGGDRFTKKPNLLVNNLTGLDTFTKGKSEPTKNKEGIDIGKLSDAVNNYSSDVVGLLRSYPNVPNPILNSETRLNKLSLQGDKVQANQDFKNALVGTENLSANVSAGIRGNLLAKKYQMNNDISQRENLANVDISNREALINSQINQQNNSLLNQFNQDRVDRNMAIQNANQSYLGNINEKMLLNKRERNAQELDLAKTYLSSTLADEGVRKKINETTGLGDRIAGGKKYLENYFPKRMGGKIKIK